MADVTLESTPSLTGTLSAGLGVLYAVAVASSCSIAAVANVTVSDNLESEARIESIVLASLQTANETLSSSPRTSVVVSSHLSGDRGLQCAARSTLSSSSLIGLDLELTSAGKIGVEANSTLSPGRKAIGVSEVIVEIMSLWGIEQPCQATSWVRSRAINDLNASMQLIWGQAKDSDYWSRTTLSLDFDALEQTVILNESIQNVVGAARLNGYPLTALQSRGELDNYGIYYLGNTSPSVAPGIPRAYYIERNAASGHDAVRCSMHVIPAPLTPSTVTLDVVLESPRYNWADYQIESSIPIPHRYVESILLPIVRKRASSFHLFVEPSRLPAIEQEYVDAMKQIVGVDPLPGREELS